MSFCTFFLKITGVVCEVILTYFKHTKYNKEC